MTTLTVPPCRPHGRGRAAAARNLLRDIRIVMARELKPVLRDPFSLLFGMIQPLVFLGLFGPLLSGLDGRHRSATASGSGSCRRSW